MANTLKFGNGQWASKEGYVLAYNDENNNFKPLPFDFTRASGATRVNKDGLIEVVGSDKPRIDFKDNSKGALLLEPSRTNTYVRSNQFETTWIKVNVSTIPNSVTSLDGSLNGYLLRENTSSGSHDIRQNATVVSGLQYTYSLFVKKLDVGQDRNLSFYIGGTNGSISFNTTDGTFFSVNSIDSYSSEDYGNGWWRLQFTDTAVTTSFNVIAIFNNGSTNYTGDGISGLYIYGAQLEEGSYATSYIPTSGASVTRVADSSIQTLPDGIIGQTEGSVYVEVNISNTTSKTILALDSGSASNFIILDTTSSLSPKILVRQSSGSFPAIITGTTMSYGVNKIAFCYKSGDYAMYVNGVLSGTSTSTTFPSGIISKISVGANSSYGYLSDTVNDVKLYNTRLSNSELAALTTI